MADIITKKRSVFNQSHSVKTTSSFGKVTPLLAEFVTPDTTMKLSSDFYTELKPTTNKLNSTIQSVLNSYYVPLKRVWEGADNFIASTGHWKRNASLNEPYFHNLKDKNIDKLPCVNVGRVIEALLASVCGTINATTDGSANWMMKTPFAAVSAIGNCSWDYYKIGNGQLRTHSTSNNRLRMSWWMWRIIGNGVSSNPMYNLDYIADANGNPKEWRLYTSDPKVVGPYNAMCKVNASGHADVPCVCLRWKNATNASPQLYFRLVECTSLYDNSSYQFTADVETLWNFRVATQGSHYGEITPNTATWDPMYISHLFAFDLVCGMLFNHSNMLGAGSLIEALGCPLFKYKQFRFSGDGSWVRKKVADKHYDLYMWSIAHTYDSMSQYSYIHFKDCFKFSALPFFAYQSIISDKYLLPLDVLSPTAPDSEGVDGYRSTPNYYPLDSHYNHNYIIPTKCYEQHPEALKDLWEGCISNYGVHLNYFLNDTSLRTNTERNAYACTPNQLASIFLDRSNLIDVDFYTHIWQMPDNNVNGLLGNTNISNPIVNASLKADAKQMLMTKKVAQFLKRGGFDMSASDFIEKHFGVKDVVEEENGCVLLSTDKQIIQCEDVLNTGGAQDESGNPLPLGQKATIASCSKPHRGSFEFYAKNFGFVLQLHHLSVANEYFNTPNVTFKRLGDSTKGTLDFAIQYSPEFQDTGDEPVYYDYYSNGSVANNPQIGWKCKNFDLKDKQNRVIGEYQDLYRTQIICPTDPLQNLNVPYGLNYEFLQKTPFDYSRYFVDATGDQILLNVSHHLYRKAPMSRENNVGYL